MAIWSRAVEALRAPNEKTARLHEELSRAALTLDYATESIRELERDDIGWNPISTDPNTVEFTREYLNQIIHRSRIAYLYHPLINRSIDVQKLYVWGQGISIKAADPDVDAVIQAFINDPQNQVELTSHQAREAKEVDLAVDGNIFFTFFKNPNTGHLRIRTIPPEQITEIITNPDDRREVWYYKRVRSERRFNLETGTFQTINNVTEYYPDWRYVPFGIGVAGRSRYRSTIGGNPVIPFPVYHVKVGGVGGMQFGVPEMYAAFDWNKADATFRQDFASVARTLQKYAAEINVGKGGKSAIAAAKSKIASITRSAAVGAGGAASILNDNPPSTAGSTFIHGEGTKLDPVKVAGATLNLSDVRYFVLMVAAAAGIPETFFGDASIGNHATSKTLDRPTELKFRNRQSLWSDILRDISDYAVDCSALSPSGRLRTRAKLEVDPITGQQRVILDDEADRSVSIEFPPILEHDMTARVDAVIKAATLNGQDPIGTLDHRTIIRMLLSALGVSDIDALLDVLAPEGGESLIDRLKAEKQAQAQQIAGDQQLEPDDVQESRFVWEPDDIDVEDEIKKLKDSLVSILADDDNDQQT